MTRLLVLLVAFVTTAHAQGYDPPNAPMDIIAPERPRGMPRQRQFVPDPTPLIEVLPLDPLTEDPRRRRRPRRWRSRRIRCSNGVRKLRTARRPCAEMWGRHGYSDDTSR